jgi:hypothetical protein
MSPDEMKGKWNASAKHSPSVSSDNYAFASSSRPRPNKRGADCGASGKRPNMLIRSRAAMAGTPLWMRLAIL